MKSVVAGFKIRSEVALGGGLGRESDGVPPTVVAPTGPLRARGTLTPLATAAGASELLSCAAVSGHSNSVKTTLPPVCGG